MLVYELRGGAAAHVLHEAHMAFPSYNTVQDHHQQVTILPCTGESDTEIFEANYSGTVSHQVLNAVLFDEISMEEKLIYFENSDKVGGLC
ncbi:hypothetical protein QCA50_019999 [Cerrena zonata]|uniref:Uncharacterized protein n=1 Tax=Cerrena zonata TaxID=2478898 RepID=A0AAW0FFY4_9APHY